jgi:hypothetical protein
MKEHPERDIQELPDFSLYEEALFIRKLKAGRTTEVTSAKTQFFNAELLAQEILDKGDLSEISSFRGLKEKLRSIWEIRFNEACAKTQVEIIGLYPTVMKAVEDQDKKSLVSSEIKATLIHKQGVVHQMANRCDVGWTRNFREEFKEYYKQDT